MADTAEPSIKKLAKGEHLMKEGEESNSMYLIVHGSFRIYKKKGNGFVDVGMVGSGELLGEMSFLDGKRRSVSVQAADECEVIEIPRAKFEEVLKTLPVWMGALLRTLVDRLRTTNARLH